MKHQKLSVVRLALSVSPIAALRSTPKEDFTPNAQRLTQNCFMRRGGFFRRRFPGMKQQKLSVVRLALSVRPIAALRLAPKEDFTLNAGRLTQNCFMRHGQLI